MVCEEHMGSSLIPTETSSLTAFSILCLHRCPTSRSAESTIDEGKRLLAICIPSLLAAKKLLPAEQEDQEVAAKYKNRSVAEQRSLDLSWDLLMEKRFKALRSTICRNERELSRFRQLLVNAVMATDLGRSCTSFHAKFNHSTSYILSIFFQAIRN